MIFLNFNSFCFGKREGGCRGACHHLKGGIAFHLSQIQCQSASEKVRFPFLGLKVSGHASSDSNSYFRTSNLH